MDLLIALVFAVLFSFAFRNAIRKVPVVFYIIAVIIDAVFLFHILSNISVEANRLIQPYFYKGLFSYGLFTVVMFIGAFSRSSWIRKYLQPIRGELSVIAAILMYGHVVNYAGSYLVQVSTGVQALRANLVISLVVSVALVVILTILTVTSFEFIRRRMDSVHWKKIQWLAYPFFILIYIHLFLVLGPSAFGFASPVVRVLIYTVILAAYLVLRIRRAVIDSARKKDASPLLNDKDHGNLDGLEITA